MPTQDQENRRCDNNFRLKLQLLGWLSFFIINSTVNYLTDQPIFSINFNFSKTTSPWQNTFNLPMTLTFLTLFGLSLYYLSLFWFDPKTEGRNKNITVYEYLAAYAVWIAFRVTSAFLLALFPTVILFAFINKVFN